MLHSLTLTVTGGCSASSSRTSLSSHYSTGYTENVWTPPAGMFQDGYSPVYLGAPEGMCEVQPHPVFVSAYDDRIRCFTASPEPLDPSPFVSRAYAKSNTRSSVSFPQWPLSSRTPSCASFTTDEGRTLSTRSSCSSLSEVHCNDFDSHPIIADSGQESISRSASGECVVCDKSGTGEVDAAWHHQPKIAMPVPMNWSQSSL